MCFFRTFLWLLNTWIISIYRYSCLKIIFIRKCICENFRKFANGFASKIERKIEYFIFSQETCEKLQICEKFLIQKIEYFTPLKIVNFSKNIQFLYEPL